MSNIITADHDANVEDIVMTNGMASVFLSVPLLSGACPAPPSRGSRRRRRTGYAQTAQWAHVTTSI